MKHYLFIAALFILSACGSDDTPADAYLPDANGSHGEILVLMNDKLWNGATGKAVVESLTQRAEGPYLRPEPMFTYFRKRPDELNHLNQLNRNLLKFMIDKDSTYAETAVVEERNYYAKNQLFVIVKDSDPQRLYDFAKNKMDGIIATFNKFELKQLIRTYETEPNRSIKELCEKKFGISVSLPKRSVLKKDRKNFLMAKHDRSKNLLPNDATRAQGGTFWIQQGFLVWAEAYDPTADQLSVENVLKSRDTTLKYNVPGRVEGTYMATEYDPYYKPEARVFDFNGSKTVEIRGLWKHDGPVFVGGGGPFVQYTMINEARNLVITVCGYVYAPKFDKREFIREIDAVLNTIEIVN